VLAGPEKRVSTLNDEEKRLIAYHEAGHAVVGQLSGHGHPLHKVSIIARGKALGITIAIPERDQIIHSRKQLEARIAMLFGGRTAEELVFGDVSTGAADDIARATDLATAMVTEYGMSDAIGLRRVTSSPDDDGGVPRRSSDELAAEIDREVRHLLHAGHAQATHLLTEHRALLDRMASELLEHETLGEHQLAAIFDSE
jgi:cell division protease FtsH